MKKQKKYLVIVMMLIMLFQFSTMCYAEWKEVTKENLNDAFQAIKTTDTAKNEITYEFEVLDDMIKITRNGEKEYILNYDLTGNPTFSVEIPVAQGMTYEEYEEETSNLILPLYGYIAIANTQGVKIEDASVYALIGPLIEMANVENTKVIMVNKDVSSDVPRIILKDSNKEFPKSEFGQHIMEYTNCLYGDKWSFSGNKDLDIDSYTWIIEEQDVTANSCKIVSTVVIDKNADFSKLNGYAELVKESLDNSFNNNNETDNNGTSNNETNNQNVTNLPQTGEGLHMTDILAGLITLSGLGLIVLYRYNKKQQ